MCWWKCCAKKQAGRRSRLVPLTPAHQPCRMVISLICVCFAAPFSCHFLPCLVNRGHLCTGRRGGKRQEARGKRPQQKPARPYDGPLRVAAGKLTPTPFYGLELQAQPSSTAQQHSPAANVVKRLLKER